MNFEESIGGENRCPSGLLSPDMITQFATEENERGKFQTKKSKSKKIKLNICIELEGKFQTIEREVQNSPNEK
jgi:hypothetical protein